MNLNELRDAAYNNAKEKGWHDKERSPLEVHMLIVSEIAEATEEVRIGSPEIYKRMRVDNKTYCVRPNERDWEFAEDEKPEGEAVELADAVIRIADYFGAKGWDLEEIVKAKMAYNSTRSHRHGGKAY